MSAVAATRVGDSWAPPQILEKPALVALSDSVLQRPDLPIRRTEHVTRIEAAGLEWDISSIVYEPEDASKIPIGPDGRKVGFFLLHGGAGDYRVHENLATMLAQKFGFRCVNMTYPGRFYFDDPEHNWPGDTIHPDGSVRTPIWKRGEAITRDQYDVVEETSLKKTYGTLISARAKPGTMFYDRLAAWPLAFETGILRLCADNFPVAEYSIYCHGHSTGGPFSHMMLQRVENAVGIAGIENSPFGYIWQMINGNVWPGPFNEVIVRNWRDKARYHGAEVLKMRGPEALRSLPELMEEVFVAWQKDTHIPNIKAEYLIHLNAQPQLALAAKAVAARLKLSPNETDALVKRYQNYPLPLTGQNVKPVPPLLYCITANSRDHSKEKYFGILLPELAKLDPAPKASVIQFMTGAHSYQRPEDGLPKGLAPAAMALWHQAIMGGYYMKA